MDYKDLEELALFGKAACLGVVVLTDGFQLSDLAAELQVAKRAPAAFSGVANAFDEYLKMDDVEKERLKAAFNADSRIPQENVESAIELVFGILVDLNGLVGLLKPAPKPAA